ncbi:MAG: hypothetical protein NTY53_10280 [Kiritimatiellaeota bacterium]|nr:hypothetical protein [Kiritimatiellota bacterium]
MNAELSKDWKPAEVVFPSMGSCKVERDLRARFDRAGRSRSTVSQAPFSKDWKTKSLLFPGIGKSRGYFSKAREKRRGNFQALEKSEVKV